MRAESLYDSRASEEILSYNAYFIMKCLFIAYVSGNLLKVYESMHIAEAGNK